MRMALGDSVGRIGELSPEELELRKSGLGASDMAAISGCNPWKSALSVWLEKTGKRPAEPSGSRARLGQRMEPLIAEWYLEQPPGHCDFWEKPTTLVHPALPWAMATPDLILRAENQSKRAEIKLVGSHLRSHWKDGVPPYVYVQAQWQGFVTGIEPCDVVVWFGLDEDDHDIIPVEYDASVVADLRDLGDRFWNYHVKRDIPPAVEATEDWSEYLAQRYARSTEPPIPAPPHAEPLVRQYLQADRAEKIAARMKLDARNQIEAMLGFASGMQGEGFKVTWKSDSKGRVDWQAVARSLGATDELAAAHVGPPSRRFTVRSTAP